MMIRTQEDIDRARRTIHDLEKAITKAEKELEQNKLESDIFGAVHDVFNSEDGCKRAEIRVFDGQYRFILSKNKRLIINDTDISLQTRNRNKEEERIISCDTISASYGFKFVYHFVQSIIFKRMALIRKELKKSESTDTIDSNSKEDDRC